MRHDYYVVNVNEIIKHANSFADSKSSGTTGLPTSLADGDNIYFDKGTYSLTQTLTIDANINVKIYGGFSGEETRINLDARDLKTNENYFAGQ